MGGMFGCLRLDVIGVWGRGDPSRSYVASHLGFLLTKGHHYNDHFSTLIYVPYLGTLLILHQVYGFIVNNFKFFFQFSQESTWTRNYHVGLNNLTINGLTWWQQSWALLAWYYYNLCGLLHGEKNMGIALNTP